MPVSNLDLLKRENKKKMAKLVVIVKAQNYSDDSYQNEWRVLSSAIWFILLLEFML